MSDEQCRSHAGTLDIEQNVYLYINKIMDDFK